MNYNRYINYEGGRIHLLDTFVYIAIDPSGGSSEQNATSRTDKCGWSVAAVNTKDERFILELNERHFDDEQFVAHLFTLNETYLPRSMGIEKTPHLLSIIRREETKRKIALPLVELRPKGRKKSARIRSSRATLGYTYFLADIQPRCQLMFRNWYDDMQHGDDGIDSFAYLGDMIVPPTEEQLTAHKTEVLKLIDHNILVHLPDYTKREVREVERLLDRHRYNEEDDLDAFYEGH
jgi:hypothetical protein